MRKPVSAVCDTQWRQFSCNSLQIYQCQMVTFASKLRRQYNAAYKFRCYTFVLLNPNIVSLENIKDPDKLASDDAVCSGSILFPTTHLARSIKHNIFSMTSVRRNYLCSQYVIIQNQTETDSRVLNIFHAQLN